MNNALAVIAVVCLAVSLSGCASNSQVAEKALGNLEYCDRTYTALIGGIGTNGGSINIKCNARPYPASVTIPAAAQ